MPMGCSRLVATPATRPIYLKLREHNGRGAGRKAVRTPGCLWLDSVA